VLSGATVSGSIPFMAVDSRTSLVGGRSNWSLPKSLATFTGKPEAGTTMSAYGPDWSVRVNARAVGPALPARAAGRVAQRWPDGSVRASVMKGRARVRPAIVRVDVTSKQGLSKWLRSGWHLGLVVSGAQFTLPEPTAS
jgi:hypothetical protein